MIASNRTLLVDGPAWVQIITGSAEVFGYELKPKKKIMVQDGKRQPFYVLENTTFNISLSAKGVIQVEGKTTPESWNQPVNEALRLKHKPAIILVVGKADVGKSSFCTFLVNRLVSRNCKVAVLDGDLGQSDVGPSGTIAYGLTAKHIVGLQSLRLQNAYFVGVKSPILAIARIIEGIASLKGETLAKYPDFVVVNTDGWVIGDIALRYKTAIIKTIKPELIVAIEEGYELEPLTANIQTAVVKIKPSPALRVRTVEKRKRLRESTYQRYLKGARMHYFSLRNIILEPKKAALRSKPGMGLLCGFYNDKNRFLGIGVLRGFDLSRQVLKIQTAVQRKPARIYVGRILLDRRLNEV